MKRLRFSALGGFLRHHWRQETVFGLCAIIGLFIAFQMTLPWDSLPLYTTIDGVAVGSQPAVATTNLLDKKYKELPISVYFGNSNKAYRQPHPADIGLTISSQSQVEAKMYSFWLRLIPTSLWWAHAVTPSVAPTYKHDSSKASVYVQKELGKSCDVTPINAGLEYKDKKLQVIPAIDGGTCKLPDVVKSLNAVTPSINSHKLRIAMDQRPAKIHDGVANDLALQLTNRSKDLTIKAGNSDVAVPADTFLSWLDFAAPDTGLVVTVNTDRSADFFAKQLLPKVSVTPGISRVSTTDFTETSRVDGAPGQTLDNAATVTLLNEWLGDSGVTLAAKVKSVPPTTVFNRSYTPTDTGMTALITQFAQAHAGDFGVSYAELGGTGRHAGYQDKKIFRTASTYKLFVAYSTLKRIEAGSFHWSDQIQGGRDLTKCFDDMIVKSDNACAEALLNKIGFRPLTTEINAIGLPQSSFLTTNIQTTAADLTTFVGSLQSGQLLSAGSTNTLISAMKRNIYRQGIPAGASGQVADKVGFLDDYLNDAAIVYSPKGVYVLSIMTKGSSWGTIAELTRKIEALRAQG
jgi:beta-lactamase class A